MKSSRLKHRVTAPGQGELFAVDEIASLYRSSPDLPITNARLYDLVSSKLGVSRSAISTTSPVGVSGQQHSLVRRAVRWAQQTLKHLGVIERCHGERGVWRLTQEAKRDLNAAKPGVKLLGFRTDLGLAIWGASGDIFKRLSTPVTLAFSSPPYGLSRPPSSPSKGAESQR